MLDSSPVEIIDQILIHSDPIEIASIAQSARFARQHIYGSDNRQHLWHKLFLKYFDNPLSNLIVRDIFLNHPSTIKRVQHHQLNHSNNVDWLQTFTIRITLRQSLSPTDDQLMKERLLKHYPGSKLNQLYSLIFLIINTALHSSPNQPSQNLTFIQHLLSNPTAQFRIIHFAGLNCQQQPIYALRATLHHPLVAAAAKLHTIYGLTSFDIDRPRARGIARESCYSVRNYTINNLYGPFIPQPTHQDQNNLPRTCQVNWPHLEALSLVVGLNLYNLRRTAQTVHQTTIQNNNTTNQHDPIPQPINTTHETPNLPIDSLLSAQGILQHHGAEDEPDHEINQDQPIALSHSKPEQIPWPILNSLHSARPFTQLMHPAYNLPATPWSPSILQSPAPIDLDQYDWAGVSGRWMRCVCFLDYRHLHLYNFENGPPIRLDGYNEAVRVMTLELKVVWIGIYPDHLDEQGNHTDLVPMKLRTDVIDRPPIYFEGTSAHNVGASSTLMAGQTVSIVRGYVSVTDDDEVRWSMVSTRGDQERWSSEGIQVGGVRSKWGVLGAWTDVDRAAAQAPVGPFYFFKSAY